MWEKEEEETGIGFQDIFRKEHNAHAYFPRSSSIHTHILTSTKFDEMIYDDTTYYTSYHDLYKR